MANRSLADFITESTLEELAGDRYFERGLACFRHGAVSRLRARVWWETSLSSARPVGLPWAVVLG